MCTPLVVVSLLLMIEMLMSLFGVWRTDHRLCGEDIEASKDLQAENYLGAHMYPKRSGIVSRGDIWITATTPWK